MAERITPETERHTNKFEGAQNMFLAVEYAKVFRSRRNNPNLKQIDFPTDAARQDIFIKSMWNFAKKALQSYDATDEEFELLAATYSFNGEPMVDYESDYIAKLMERTHGHYWSSLPPSWRATNMQVGLINKILTYSLAHMDEWNELRKQAGYPQGK